MVQLIACLIGVASVAAMKGAPRELFLDLDRVERIENLTQTVHAAVKHPLNPIMRAEKPWEGSSIFINGSPAVRFDSAQRRWHLWYFAYASLNPGGQFKETFRPAYATSSDGIAWDRPVLGQLKSRGSTRNNLLDWDSIIANGCTNVLYDLHDPDSSRRYKSLYDSYPSGGRFADGGLFVSFSPDGLRWKDHPGNPVLPRAVTHDTHTILGWDETSGKYVAFLRPMYDSGDPNQVRVIGRSVSDDFVHWSDPGLDVVLRPDPRDLKGSEFYGMAVAKYESHYIGFVWVYHNDPHWPWPKGTTIAEDQLKGDQQKVHSELVFSRDGRRWTRTRERAPIVGMGKTGEWDLGMIYATNPVLAGNQIHIYYGGMNVLHTRESLGSIGTTVGGVRRQAGIGLATLRRDGYASLDAGAKQGMLLTKPVRLVGGRLYLNVDAAKGSVRVEILDERSHVLADSQPFSGDSTELQVQWKSGEPRAMLQNTEVRLRLHLRKARLYSYWSQ